MLPQIKVDARQAFARFSPRGIPEQVRANLRRMLPSLLREVGAAVDARLESSLKSRRRLQTKKEMIENARSIGGRVTLQWTGDRAQAMVPRYLEEGTRPHEIVAKRAGALRFFWPKVGGVVMFKRVMHPGTQPYRIMESAMERMQPRIVEVLTKAVREGASRR